MRTYEKYGWKKSVTLSVLVWVLPQTKWYQRNVGWKSFYLKVGFACLQMLWLGGDGHSQSESGKCSMPSKNCEVHPQTLRLVISGTWVSMCWRSAVRGWTSKRREPFHFRVRSGASKKMKNWYPSIFRSYSHFTWVREQRQSFNRSAHLSCIDVQCPQTHSQNCSCIFRFALHRHQMAIITHSVRAGAVFCTTLTQFEDALKYWLCALSIYEVAATLSSSNPSSSIGCSTPLICIVWIPLPPSGAYGCYTWFWRFW